MKKTILQTLSGGYDSTWLLIKNLKEGHDIYPIYIHSSSVNPIKQVIEFNSVKIIIDKLQSRFDNLHNLTEVEVNLETVSNVISMQPIFWMLGLFNEIKNNCKYMEHDEVNIGYIMQDSAVSYMKEIQNFWKALFSFSFPEYKTPKLKFPLIKYQKTAIINELKMFDYEIFEKCWFCEKPTIIKTKKLKDGNIESYIEACGECNPCTRIKNINNHEFNKVKKYKTVLRFNDFINALNKTIRKNSSKMIWLNESHDFMTVEEIDEKTIKKLERFKETEKPSKILKHKKRPPKH